nr:DNA helicase [Tanacetum cinerariifolium]
MQYWIDTSNNIVRRPPLTTRNHAYLCVDAKDCIIRPAIIRFLNNIQENKHYSSASVYSHVFATNEGSTANVRKRKNMSPLLAKSPEEASFSRNIRRRYTPATSNTRRANVNRNFTSTNSQNLNLNATRARGFYPELKLKPHDGTGRGKKATMNAYYKYQLHPRRKEFRLIFKGGRLFQQYVVTIFYAIEQSRLDFIRKNQNDLRSDFLSGLYDAVSRGDHEGISAGSKIMLPSTFTRGPRYMYNHYLDALAICRSLGNPQFFITFMCNVKWLEIKRYMAQYPELTPNDRADIYRRRDTWIHVMKGESKLDNCNVVSYNRPDRILAKFSNSEASTSVLGANTQIDKIKNYVDGRFIHPYEACWRIFDFSIHFREPVVKILNVYLVNMQCVNFREKDSLDIIVNIPEKKKTTITEWFVYNNENTDGRHLTYLNFPSEFMCDLTLPTFRAVCEALGLLGGDKEWDITLRESTASATSN